MSSKRFRWGILATGWIADVFAKGLDEADRGSLVRVGSRSPARAAAFAEERGLSCATGGYEDVLADPDVDGVYVALPHPMHAEWAIRAARAGKHVLCEKPLTLNFGEAMAVADAAEQAQVAMMEAFAYRFNPETQKVLELVDSGAIGRLQRIVADYSFALAEEEIRLVDPELGGGSILDVGCYCVNLARLLAGRIQGEEFAEPVRVAGMASLGASGADLHAAALLSFEDGLLGQLSCGIGLEAKTGIVLIGSGGEIRIPVPAWHSSDEVTGEIVIDRHGEEPETITVLSPVSHFALEADAFAELAAQPDRWETARADALGNVRVLDEWRDQAGIAYPAELPQPTARTVGGNDLSAPAQTKMPYFDLDGVDVSISRLVMGADNQTNYSHAAVMFDAFFEHGGTAFDTAWVYGNDDGEGLNERLLGDWIDSRGIRDQVAILGKGAHTPHCAPHWIRPQLEESLERLKTDHVDIYMLHRDNPRYEAGEFVDELNSLKAEGLLRRFGASNWSLGRVQEAEAHATERGIEGFSAISNQFSLAEMLVPTWDGCLSAWGPEWREWLSSRQIPLMPWSSLAAGFLARPADFDWTGGEIDMPRSWHSPGNFARHQRLWALAADKGLAAGAVGVAYVLRQPFPTLPLIGPRTLAEMRVTLTCLDVQLSPEEIAYLDEGEPPILDGAGSRS